MYYIYLYNGDDELIEILDKASDITIENGLNKAGTASFTLKKGDTKATFENINGKNYVLIYRDTIAVFGGKIADISLTAEAETTINVVCMGWAYWLNNYELTKKYTSPTVIGVFAWDLINTCQAKSYGDLGITQGSDNTTDNIYIRTYERQKVYDALINLTETQNMFDFEITPLRVFNSYIRKGSDKTSTIKLEYNSGLKNIKSISARIGFSNIKNYIYAVGDRGHYKTATDLNSMIEYGRREESITEMNWKDATTLQSKANEAVRIRSRENYDCQLELIPNTFPLFSDWIIGDTVSVVFDNDTFTFSENMRIYGYTLNYSNGSEKLSLNLNKIT